WVGSVDNPHENHATVPITVNGVTHMPMYGSRVAAPAWKEYMDVAVEGMPVKDFGAPDQSLIGSPPVTAPPPSSDDGDDDGGDDDGGDDDGPGNGGGPGNGRGPGGG